MGPLVVFNAIVWLSTSRFCKNIFGIKPQSLQKWLKLDSFGASDFFGEWPIKIFTEVCKRDLSHTIGHRLVELKNCPKLCSVQLAHLSNFLCVPYLQIWLTYQHVAMFGWWCQLIFSETPKCLWQFVSTIYLLPFSKVWLSYICWPCAKPGMKQSPELTAGW